MIRKSKLYERLKCYTRIRHRVRRFSELHWISGEFLLFGENIFLNKILLLGIANF